MNFKYATTSMMLVLIALSVSITSIQNDAFAQSSGMSITASADGGSDTITISGQTMSQIGNITLKVTSPSGSNLVGIEQVQPDAEGNFEAMFVIGDLWKENGFYSIAASQGTSSYYNLEVSVEVIDGMTAETSTTQSNLGTGMLDQMTGDFNMMMGLSIEADAVIGSTTIGITGTTDKMGMPITLVVTAPNGNVVSVDQVSPDINGAFATDITTGGPLWKQDGNYVVSAQQGEEPEYNASVMVEIEDGVIVPEFGTIAAMILAVAIVSIIAISARSRLSIMPRY